MPAMQNDRFAPPHVLACGRHGCCSWRSALAVAAVFAERDAPGHQRTAGETGAYKYMAPEVVRHDKYSMKCDVYSFAVVVYELFEGLVATPDPQKFARDAAVRRKRPECATLRGQNLKRSRAVEGLIAACWCAALRPPARPTAAPAAARLLGVSVGWLVMRPASAWCKLPGYANSPVTSFSMAHYMVTGITIRSHGLASRPSAPTCTESRASMCAARPIAGPMWSSYLLARSRDGLCVRVFPVRPAAPKQRAGMRRMHPFLLTKATTPPPPSPLGCLMSARSRSSCPTTRIPAAGGGPPARASAARGRGRRARQAQAQRPPRRAAHASSSNRERADDQAAAGASSIFARRAGRPPPHCATTSQRSTHIPSGRGSRSANGGRRALPVAAACRDSPPQRHADYTQPDTERLQQHAPNTTTTDIKTMRRATMQPAAAWASESPSGGCTPTQAAAAGSLLASEHAVHIHNRVPSQHKRMEREGEGGSNASYSLPLFAGRAAAARRLDSLLLASLACFFLVLLRPELAFRIQARSH